MTEKDENYRLTVACSILVYSSAEPEAELATAAQHDGRGVAQYWPASGKRQTDT